MAAAAAAATTTSSSNNKPFSRLFKELSLSFRAECMCDVSCVMTSLLKNDQVMSSLQDYTIKSGSFGEVDGVFVFRFYKGSTDAATTTATKSFIGSLKHTLDIMQCIDDADLHVINESINFTDEYDGDRDDERCISDRLSDKLASTPFRE